MPNTNTTIQFKRSELTRENFASEDYASETLQYGEPLFFEPNADGKHKYLAIGNGTEGIGTATFFAGITDTNLIDKTVYADDNNVAILADNTFVGTSTIVPTKANISTTDTTKYYLLSCTPSITSNKNVFYHTDDAGDVSRGIYITGNGVLCGSAWNDYAERRLCDDSVQPGNVVCECGDGKLSLSTEKLQILPHVVSDTYGMIIGGETGIPVSVVGRALVFVDCDVSFGDVLCANKNGMATKMTRQEIANYPDRILGIVSEIPTYDTWNGISVNNRVWINIK